MKFNFYILALAASLLWTVNVAFGEEDLSDAQRVELPIGKPLNLEKYGGPNVDITVRANGLTNITYSTTDYEHNVVVPSTTIDSVTVNGSYAAVTGTSKAVISPSSVPRGKEKKNGVEVNKRETAYLLYESKTGLRVYFLDTSFTGMDECVILVKTKTAEASIADAKQKLQRIDALFEAKLLTQTEYDRMRKEVLADALSK